MEKLEALRDQSAEAALRSRERIEQAVDAGDLPIWVMDAVNDLEREAMAYADARAKLAQRRSR